MVTARLHLLSADPPVISDVATVSPQVRYTIGSDPSNGLVLPESEALPFHAGIYWQDGQIWLIKCSCAATLAVNDCAVTTLDPILLHNGDRVQVGHMQLCLELKLPEYLQAPDSQLPVTLVTPRHSQHFLQIQTPDWVQESALDQAECWLGQADSCNIVLDWPDLAAQHLKFTWTGAAYCVENHGPSGSLQLEGRPIDRRSLQDGDQLSIGKTLTLQYSSLPSAAEHQTQPKIEAISLQNRASLRLGRDPRNDVVLPYPVVSRFHAVLEWEAGHWWVVDLSSANGTFVNDQSVDRTILYPGDGLHIGPYEFQLTDQDVLIQQFEVGKLRLDASNLTYRLKNSLTLLDNVSLSILPDEFVTIVGVSGAGKSTLLNALSAFRPATRGTVFVNGHNLYRHYDAYRTELGYVPQDDIIHRELTVQQALDFAARLRLPKDISRPERRRQVQQVLADLELVDQAQTPVQKLSGGQRKRVSIGVELLTKPSLFFLDEATSGLDPGTELQMMRLLRRLADQGRTVILVTHTTKNLMLSDLVVFLAKGGRVAFFGPPQEALAYFGVQEFDEIYIKIEEEQSPETWAQQYQNSALFQRYVAQRQEALEFSNLKVAPRPVPSPGPQRRDTSFLRQFLLLSQRNLAILRQDRGSFFFLIAVTPLLGILDFVTWPRAMFDATVGDPSQCFTLLFIAVLIAVIVGSLSTMRELVKEAEIYRRERMIGLNIGPYILSKFWISILLAAYQAAIILLTKAIAVDLPGGWAVLAGLYLTLFLATLGGMVMGLLVSALATTQNMAPLLAILFLVPQIIFAGSFLPLSSMGPLGQGISQFTITRWAYESMVSLSGLGRDVALDPCWQVPEATRDRWQEADKRDCRCMGPKLFERCAFPGIKQEYHPAVDQTEPPKPQDPGNPPPVPQTLLGASGQAYADDLEQYVNESQAYRDQLSQWQDTFSQWKEKRERAIAAGEELLNRFRRNQGNTFAVNVGGHWLKLGLLILGTLVLLAGVQKRKDWA